VHVVTLLEEMPVQETVDAIAELTQLGFPVGRVIVNGSRPPAPAGREVSAAELKRGLAAAGLPTDARTVAGLAEEARDQRVRRELEDSLRAELAERGLPLTELPLLPEGVDRAGLETLARALVRAD
jgi:anion-transporting  ArsA/GET3 family ATPase